MSLSFEIAEGVGVITFNRPEARNAISKQMWEQIPSVLETMQAEGVSVVVFRGQGSAFAAGADLTELAAITNREDAASLWLAIESALDAVAGCPIPTIAMIKGPCMGGGCLLAIACDMRIAELGARFSIPVAQLGITLDDANLMRLLMLTGPAVTAELLFAGAVLSAERAEKVGLINAIVSSEDLQSVVNQAAINIKANSSDAIAQLKQALIRLKSNADSQQDQSDVIGSYLTEDFRARVSRALNSIRPA